MKHSKIVLILSALFPILSISAEPSAFGAGNLNSSNPYGLTSNEKVILDTKDKLHKVSLKSNNQANKLDSLRERIDGLQSIVESLSRKAHNNKVNLQKQDEKNTLSSQSINEYEQRLGEVAEANAKAIEQQKVLILEMTLLLDAINAQYVSKEDFNSLVNDINKFKDLIAKELKQGTKKGNKKENKSKFSSMKSSEIYDQAKMYFNKKYYTNAIKNYEYLIKKNYKPAYAHYMIGEMNFKRKNYANAITYFKKSSSLYSKASYMPNLMLHTAISMSRTGDENHATLFFEAIVAKYPNSNEAKEAKNYLQP